MRRILSQPIGDINLIGTGISANYEFGPAFLNGTPKSKKHYLDLMIYEKLLAYGWISKRIAPTRIRDQILKAYEEDIVTEELFKEEVMNEVSVTDEEIEHGHTGRTKLHLSLRWLYADTEQTIIEHWNALNGGCTLIVCSICNLMIRYQSMTGHWNQPFLDCR